MNTTNVVAGEVLEPGNLVHMIQNRAYKICDNRQIPSGVISKHCEIGDVVDDCMSRPIGTGGVRYPNDCIGLAGEVIIEGGVIELHADGEWYNKRSKTQGAKEDMNLMDGTQIELERVKELLKLYQSIPSGVFGAMMIQQAIDYAEECIREGDTVGMVKAYQDLKSLE